MNTQNGFANILIIILGLLVVVGGGYVYLDNKQEESIMDNQVVDTQEELENVQEDASDNQVSENDAGIVITSPTNNQLTKPPVSIKGYVSNPKEWAIFEGNAGSVELYGSHDGEVTRIGVVPLTLLDFDYDKKPPFYFDVLVGDRQWISNLDSDEGYVLIKENVVKDGEIAQEIKIPVRFDTQNDISSNTENAYYTDNNCSNFSDYSLSMKDFEEIYNQEGVVKKYENNSVKEFISFGVSNYNMDFDDETGFSFLESEDLDVDLLDSQTPILPTKYLRHKLPETATNVKVGMAIGSCVYFEKVNIPGIERNHPLAEMRGEGIGNLVELDNFTRDYPEKYLDFEFSSGSTPILNLLIRPYLYEYDTKDLYLFDKSIIVVEYVLD